MTLDEQVQALRYAVGLSALEHVRCVRLGGEGAYDAADRLFSRELYIRDGQLSQGLLLREDGTIFGDCYLASDDEDFLLLIEGPGEDHLSAYLQRHLDGIPDLEVHDETRDHAIIGMDGPYAWELLSLIVGPEVIGLPYLTLFHVDGARCYRAGKTGEFGYRLILPRLEFEATWARLLEAGQPLDVAQVGLEALDQCALDNWFFNIRAEGRAPVTPIELQLQWRVSYQKSFVGSTAVRARRADGIELRLTCLTSPGPIGVDDAIVCHDQGIGVVVNAAFSPIRKQWIALGLLDLAFAYPGIGPLNVGASRIPGHTVAPPVLNNRSLYVNPQIHSYATRLEDLFPSV